MQIGMFGTGYVGLVIGVCLASKDFKVICFEKDKNKLNELKRAVLSFYEPDLEEYLVEAIKMQKIDFTDNAQAVIENSQVVFIAVDAPPISERDMDVTDVLNVAAEIGSYMQDELVVVIKTTVPVGTGKKVAALIKEHLAARKSDVDFSVVSNPEFFIQGDAMNSFLRTCKVVVGTDNPKAAELIREIYDHFYSKDIPYVVTNNDTAELVKILWKNNFAK